LTTVGVLGGGQLGRMLALAGAPLGIRLVVVEPGDDPPAAAAAEVIRAAYGDPAALDDLARRCDVVTVELEHVPVDALAWLAERLPVHPSPDVVAITQDRAVEKCALADAGIETAPWAHGLVAFPGGTVVKARRGGYDGRGQVVVADGDDLQSAAHLGPDVISEGVVALDRELSIVAARSVDGEIAAYPLVENLHADGILRRTLAPAPAVPPATGAAAASLARRLLETVGYVGVAAIELFEVAGALVANEVAPRVHNSGHWTIEGATTSQFEQHLRAITGMPLGGAEPRGVSAMINLIGQVPDLAAVLAVPGAHLHLYGKASRPARKLGHVTVTADDEAELAVRLDRLSASLL
jgi:5-(carboxyamino)imidazole ribonucleotide synthase